MKWPDAAFKKHAASGHFGCQVIPQLGAKKNSDIAILFPSAMAACETMRTEGNKERRLDLLGWYKACRDLGLEADVIDGRSFGTVGRKRSSCMAVCRA